MAIKHVDGLNGVNAPGGGLTRATAVKTVAYLFATIGVAGGDEIWWHNRHVTREVLVLGARPAGISIKYPPDLFPIGTPWDWQRFDVDLPAAWFVLDQDNGARQTWVANVSATGNNAVPATAPNTVTFDWETAVDPVHGGHKAHLTKAANLAGTRAAANSWWYDATGGAEKFYITVPVADVPLAGHTISYGRDNFSGFAITADNFSIETSPALCTDGHTGSAVGFGVIVTGLNATITIGDAADSGYKAAAIVGTGRIKARSAATKVSGQDYVNSVNGTAFFTIQPTAADTALAEVRDFKFMARHTFLDRAGVPIPLAAGATYHVILHTTGGRKFLYGAGCYDCTFRDLFGQAGGIGQMSDAASPNSDATGKVRTNYGLQFRRCKAYREQRFNVFGAVATINCDFRLTRMTVCAFTNPSTIASYFYTEGSMWLYDSTAGNVAMFRLLDNGAGVWTRMYAYFNTFVDIATNNRNAGFVHWVDDTDTHQALISGDGNVFVNLDNDVNIQNRRRYFNANYGGAATHFGTVAMRAGLQNSIMIGIGTPDDMGAVNGGVDVKTFAAYANNFPDSGDFWFMRHHNPFRDSALGANGEGGDFRISEVSPLFSMRRRVVDLAIRPDAGYDGAGFSGLYGGAQGGGLYPVGAMRLGIG